MRATELALCQERRLASYGIGDSQEEREAWVKKHEERLREIEQVNE